MPYKKVINIQTLRLKQVLYIYLCYLTIIFHPLCEHLCLLSQRATGLYLILLSNLKNTSGMALPERPHYDASHVDFSVTVLLVSKV